MGLCGSPKTFTLFSPFEKQISPQPEIKANLEFRLHLRSVLLYFIKRPWERGWFRPAGSRVHNAAAKPKQGALTTSVEFSVGFSGQMELHLFFH